MPRPPSDPGYLDAIFDTLREPLLVLDADLHVLAANRAFYRVFEVDRDQTRGSLLYELGNGQWNIPHLRAMLEGVLPQHSHFEDFEVDHIFEHIGRRVMLLNARTIYRPGNQVETILLVIEDVTARRAAEDALRLRNAEMEQFIYTVSHDLKSPLVTVTGFVGLLEGHLAAGREEKVAHTMARIRRAAHRMSRLIEDLLQLSRIGSVQGELVDVDVSALIAAMRENLAERLEATGCTLVVAPPLPAVRTDPGRLAEVFENLISNALKYGCQGEEMRIEVGSVRTDGEVRYYVRDDGPGIDPAYHEKIFGLFQRLDTRQEGTGVGLAMVAKIMQAQGGRAWVLSEEGQGATFWLAFPANALAS